MTFFSFFFFALLFQPMALAEAPAEIERFPLEMDNLMTVLTDAHEQTDNGATYPQTVSYKYIHYNMLNDTLKEEKRTIIIAHKPERIVPHSVGIAEILWAICPHDRIVLVHKACTDPRFSLLAKVLPSSVKTYGLQDAEIVIGSKPDLVLTTYYSGKEFKEMLKTASVPFVEMGFFGDFSSIQEQILLVGELIGEKPSAKRLVETIEDKIEMIKTFVEKRRAEEKLKVLYYGERGYVAGLHSTFDSLCRILGVVNIASANGLRFYKQVDYERILKWNPDVIIVEEESDLEEELYSQPILKTAKAIQRRNIKRIPSVYLLASSQYVVASLNYLAGLLYAKQ